MCDRNIRSINDATAARNSSLVNWFSHDSICDPVAISAISCLSSRDARLKTKRSSLWPVSHLPRDASRGSKKPSCSPQIQQPVDNVITRWRWVDPHLPVPKTKIVDMIYRPAVLWDRATARRNHPAVSLLADTKLEVSGDVAVWCLCATRREVQRPTAIRGTKASRTPPPLVRSTTASGSASTPITCPSVVSTGVGRECGRPALST
jgi:hypothetical protein